MTRPIRMLKFIQVMPHALTNGDFLLRDLPSSGRRIDILCRDLAACFDWAPVSWSKLCLRLSAVLSDAVTLVFQDPGPMLPTGEVEWAQVIRDSLMGNPPDFVEVRHAGTEQAVKDALAATDSAVWVLDPEGKALSEVSDLRTRTENSFMLGDHLGIDANTRQIADKYGVRHVSLGKTSYLGSHCVAALISEYERMGI